ncbi:uncharacterized protein AMSG_09438 [Thecamonas trahens ATCC 50062]|uniref:Calpain catalytic domain-containing protein n=1 Tax=Thecamonas trahens ATCC 50062 TaxID=461836 RepID=A0A0L0DN42_THETB|nr:hypothetical protein AMSG_09438 [Thecamonas trahens ATCC 50062]KNC53727.1 hypothetical protein AMSG_09438 [Thecamonas trahens ATCC 50062]|eukprot:XP_013754291.1 hypothetical protein AMSG_09438 [Thecamonas trahens ATCC 50062]
MLAVAAIAGAMDAILVTHAEANAIAAVVLYVDGEWWPVLVDEELPVHHASRLPTGLMPLGGRVDMWMLLLERALAKTAYATGYESLRGCYAPHVLETLTGGLVVNHELPHAAPPLLAPGSALLWRGTLTNGTDVEQIEAWISFVGGRMGGGGVDSQGVFDVVGEYAGDGSVSFQLNHHALLETSGVLRYHGTYMPDSGKLAGKATSLLYPGYVTAFELTLASVPDAAELCLFASPWEMLSRWWRAEQPLLVCGTEPHEAYPVVDVALTDGVPWIAVREPDPTAPESRVAAAAAAALAAAPPGKTPVADGIRDPAHWLPLDAFPLRGFVLSRAVMLTETSAPHVLIHKGYFAPPRAGEPPFDDQWLACNPQYALRPSSLGLFTISVSQPDSRRHAGWDSYPIGVGFRVYISRFPTDTIRDMLDAFCIADIPPVPGKRSVSIDLALLPLSLQNDDGEAAPAAAASVHGRGGGSGRAYFVVPYTSTPSVGLPYILRVAAATEFTLELRSGTPPCGVCGRTTSLGLVLQPGALPVCDGCYYRNIRKSRKGKDRVASASAAMFASAAQGLRRPVAAAAAAAAGAGAGPRGAARQSAAWSALAPGSVASRKLRAELYTSVERRICVEPFFCLMCKTQLVGECYYCVDCPPSTFLCPVCRLYFNQAHDMIRINVLEVCAGCKMVSFVGARYECITCSEGDDGERAKTPALVLCARCVADGVVARPGHVPGKHVLLEGRDDEGERWRVETPKVPRVNIGREPRLNDDGMIVYSGSWTKDAYELPYRTLLTQLEAAPPPTDPPPPPLQVPATYRAPRISPGVEIKSPLPAALAGLSLGPSALSSSTSSFSLLPPWSLTQPANVQTSALRLPCVSFSKDFFVDANDSIDVFKQWWHVLRPLSLLGVVISDAVSQVATHHDWAVYSDPRYAGTLYFVPPPVVGLPPTWSPPIDVAAQASWSATHLNTVLEDPPPELPAALLAPATALHTRGASAAAAAATSAIGAPAISGAASGVITPSYPAASTSTASAGATTGKPATSPESRVALAAVAIVDAASRRPSPGELAAVFRMGAGRLDTVSYYVFRNVVRDVLGVNLGEAQAVALFEDLDPSHVGRVVFASFCAAVDAAIRDSSLD